MASAVSIGKVILTLIPTIEKSLDMVRAKIRGNNLIKELNTKISNHDEALKELCDISTDLQKVIELQQKELIAYKKTTLIIGLFSLVTFLILIVHMF